MIEREFWGVQPNWLDWVRDTWLPDTGRVQLQHGDHPCRLEFAARASESFTRLGAPVTRIKTWVSVQRPENGSGYADEYPHVHYPLDAMTLVHYLDPGDAPAPLHIFDGEEVVEVVTPEAGLAVFMPNDLKHGVLKNNGTTDRIQLIATALR